MAIRIPHLWSGLGEFSRETPSFELLNLFSATHSHWSCVVSRLASAFLPPVRRPEFACLLRLLPACRGKGALFHIVGGWVVEVRLFVLALEEINPGFVFVTEEPRVGVFPEP